jgi:hypothetical protein
MRNLSWLALFPTQVKRAEEKRVTQTEARAGLCRDKIVAVSTTLPVNIPRFLRKVQSQQPWSRASSGIPFADHSLFLSSCAHSFIFTERALAVTMGVEPPFLYDHPSRYSCNGPADKGFNPKAATVASWAPAQPKTKRDGPLVDFNRHPDSVSNATKLLEAPPDNH